MLLAEFKKDLGVKKYFKTPKNIKYSLLANFIQLVLEGEWIGDQNIQKDFSLNSNINKYFITIDTENDTLRYGDVYIILSSQRYRYGVFLDNNTVIEQPNHLDPQHKVLKDDINQLTAYAKSKGFKVVWLRPKNSKNLTPSSIYANVKDYGAIGDGVTDDCEAFKSAIASGKTVFVPKGNYAIYCSIVMPPGLKIIGEGPAVQFAPKLIASGGLEAIFVTGGGFVSESGSIENLAFDSSTPGVGSAFYGAINSYISQYDFTNCVFFSNLQYGFNAPIIICRFYNCDFGSYPGTFKNFQAINATGTVGSFEPNLNTFNGCVFRKSTAPHVIKIGAYGSQWTFIACDFEINKCTESIIDYDGAGEIKFIGGYIENNDTPYFLVTHGNPNIAYCQSVNMTGMHVNAPVKVAVLKKNINNYPYLTMNGCYGGLARSKIMEDADGITFNNKNGIESFYGNHFNPGAGGSLDELARVSVPGYNTRRIGVVNLVADDFRVYNTIDKAANAEYLRMYAASDIYYILPVKTGTGNINPIRIQSSPTTYFQIYNAPTGGFMNAFASSNVEGSIVFLVNGNMTTDTGTQYGQVIQPKIDQTGTGGYIALYVNAIQDSLGSGTHLLADFRADHESMFSVSNTGNIKIADGGSISVGSTTGTKIGTSINHKIGFWNTEPVTKQTLAIGAGKTVDDVISLLQLIGLCKQT